MAHRPSVSQAVRARSSWEETDDVASDQERILQLLPAGLRESGHLLAVELLIASDSNLSSAVEQGAGSALSALVGK